MTAANGEVAAGPTADDRRRRRRMVWIIVIGGLVLLVAGGVSAALGLAGFIKGMAREPWALLQQAVADTKTDAGAEAFHRRHPGLVERYPTAAEFVAASRGWRDKAGRLPAEVPGIWEVAKGKGEMNVERSNDVTTFKLAHFNGVSVRVVTRSGALVDLAIE